MHVGRPTFISVFFATRKKIRWAKTSFTIFFVCSQDCIIHFFFLEGKPRSSGQCFCSGSAGFSGNAPNTRARKIIVNWWYMDRAKFITFPGWALTFDCWWSGASVKFYGSALRMFLPERKMSTEPVTQGNWLNYRRQIFLRQTSWREYLCNIGLVITHHWHKCPNALDLLIVDPHPTGPKTK